jgi:hypothetical protein
MWKGIIVKLRLTFGIVLCLALGSAAMASDTWYVDGVTGSDSNSCESSATACATIGRALSRAFSGDSIMVAPATYGGTVVVSASVTIVGAGAGKTIIAGSTSQTYDAVVVIPSQTPQLSVSLSGMTITGGGSGVVNFGKLAISDSVLARNVSGGGYGGGILNVGTLTVNKITVNGNTAQDGGAGITCVGTYPADTTSMNINNSTISGNTVRGSDSSTGGGIYTAQCPTTINNSTISGNSVSGLGGGVASFSSLIINNSTISDNSGPSGGGIYVRDKTTTTFQNSILSDNLSSGFGNCFAPGILISNGYNLSSDDSCKFSSVGDMINTDPKLGPLQNNGGPTETMALQCMSPAINAGNPAGCTDGHGHLLHTDQRGDKRPGDPALTTGCDIGAYEVQFPK